MSELPLIAAIFCERSPIVNFWDENLYVIIKCVSGELSQAVLLHAANYPNSQAGEPLQELWMDINRQLATLLRQEYLYARDGMFSSHQSFTWNTWTGGKCTAALLSLLRKKKRFVMTIWMTNKLNLDKQLAQQRQWMVYFNTQIIKQ